MARINPNITFDGTRTIHPRSPKNLKKRDILQLGRRGTLCDLVLDEEASFARCSSSSFFGTILATPVLMQAPSPSQRVPAGTRRKVLLHGIRAGRRAAGAPLARGLPTNWRAGRSATGANSVEKPFSARACRHALARTWCLHKA